MRGSKRSHAWAWLVSMGGGALVLLAAQLRILTYASGQDPFTYVRLGLDLLDCGFSREALREVAQFIIPGYPLILAGVAHGFGPYALPWVGFFFCGGALAGLLRLCKQWGLGPWHALLLVWTLLWLVWSGDPLYAHFLLYAFRGAPQFMAMVWAFVLVEGADPTRRKGAVRLGLVTCVLLAGALIRETTLMALPALMAWVALAPAWKGRRWLGLTSLIMPVALILSIATGVFLFLGWGGNLQVQTWWLFLMQMDARAYGARVMNYASVIRADARWPGLVLFILGICFHRRHPHRLVLWILPAVGLAFFYAVFMLHRRYVLDSYVLLMVVAASGMAWVVKEGSRRLSPLFRRWFLAGALVLMLGLNGHEIRRLPVWQQQVSREQVRHLVAATRRHMSEPERIWTDWNCPFLIEAAWTYLGVNPLANWNHFPAQLDRDGWYYWRVVEWTNFPGIRCEDLIRRHADLQPLADEAGAAEEAALGSRHYELLWATPWQVKVVNQAWLPAPEGPPLIWLDFQKSDPEAKRQVRLVASDGAERHHWVLPPGNGLMPLYMEPALLAGGDSFRVVVESSNLIPAELIRVPEVRHGRAVFTMVQGRWPSAVQWVLPPAHRGSARDKWGVGITQAARFEFPLPAVDGGKSSVISLLLEPRFRQKREVVFHYRMNGEEAASFTNWLHRGRFRHELPAPPGVESGFVQVDMTVEVPEDWDNHFRLVEIGYQLQ